MFYIILQNGNIEISNETNRNFDRFATVEDLANFAKKSDETAEVLLEKGEVLSWIVTTNGQVARGGRQSPNFERYATQEEVEEHAGSIDGAELRTEFTVKPVDFDLNKDGKVDQKDLSIAGQVLVEGKKDEDEEFAELQALEALENAVKKPESKK